MAILRMSDIRKMSLEEKRKRLYELENELLRDWSLVKSGGALENPGRVREIRRSIARLKTAIREESG